MMYVKELNQQGLHIVMMMITMIVIENRVIDDVQMYSKFHWYIRLICCVTLNMFN